VKSHYPGADSHTIFLILIQQFKTSAGGSQAQGEAFPDGFVDSVTVDGPSRHCAFLARLGVLGSSSTTCVPPHELGHHLTDPSSSPNGVYAGPDPDDDHPSSPVNLESGNHYGGSQYNENLMKAHAGDPAPGSVSGSRRLWNDSGHQYQYIPITNQIDFMRQSNLLQ
jgi:hypothetical protein